MSEKIFIFDSTLRDGEQTPGARLNREEKLELARQLARLGVDIIEAGFPISSPGELKAVQEIARQVKGPVICALARAVKGDIDAAWEAIKEAERPRLHVFLGASDIHMKYKLRKDPELLLEQAVEAVKYARRFADDVEYSPEDATRAREEYLCRVIEGAIKAGATVINIPDTVGYAVPEEFGALIRRLREKVPGAEKVIFSVHCHNDLGLAVANSLAAIENGARQVECNINGIGERAGNAALEEIVVALRIRQDHYPYHTDINFGEIYRTSRLVSKLTGIRIPVNKAVVGINAFAHSSGIHQDGVLKDKRTYEIIDADLIGGKAAQMFLTARSGRHAVKNQLQQLGYTLTEEQLESLYHRFVELADKKKEIFPEDLEALVFDHIFAAEPVYRLDYLQTVSGSRSIPSAVIRLKCADDSIIQEVAVGSGPIDAAYNAINKIVGLNIKLENYQLNAVTKGRDALGEVAVKISYQNKTILGRGTSTDIVEASVKAYLDGVNKLLKINGYNNYNNG
ncbi:MAG: 2-isopropylmalate synthase [Dethiobacteria bacterium]|jgi:2-isopropylmalate synthase|nr:2-isopropylmalate synthase [Bacillota bacterium]HOP69579.1 2-isopropylmalate synthase [Bacillota bacterium]HPT34508.1 2-isopropylmalate synthase [Bacillota bacterium]HQD06345.1 2-isopropylmalate synthase [Bacillota bacterium]